MSSIIIYTPFESNNLDEALNKMTAHMASYGSFKSTREIAEYASVGMILLCILIHHGNNCPNVGKDYIIKKCQETFKSQIVAFTNLQLYEETFQETFRDVVWKPASKSPSWVCS